MILGGFEPHKSNGGGGHLLQFPSTNIVQVMSNPESLLSDLLMVMKIRRRRQGIQRGPKIVSWGVLVWIWRRMRIGMVWG